MTQDAPRRRRARPVADAPLEALLTRSDALAKGWLLALLEAAPLQRAPAILTEPLTRDGPRLCAAAVRALADDAELRRFAPEGSLWRLAGQVGHMTGSSEAADVSRAVDALHDVLWAALCDELRAPDGELVTALSQRLARVCACIREAALECAVDPQVGSERAVERERVVPPEPAAASERAVPPEPAAASERVVSADPAGAPEAAATAAAGDADSLPLWMSALADEVDAATASARPLSLLLAELEDAERALVSASAEQAEAARRDFAGGLRRALRPGDILVWESESRAWIIARATTRCAAHALGARIAEAVGEGGPLGGAPLAASVGVAVLGEDGASSRELLEAAEEARFSASARGIEVSRRAPEPDDRVCW